MGEGLEMMESVDDGLEDRERDKSAFFVESEKFSLVKK